MRERERERGVDKEHGGRRKGKNSAELSGHLYNLLYGPAMTLGRSLQDSIPGKQRQKERKVFQLLCNRALVPDLGAT